MKHHHLFVLALAYIFSVTAAKINAQGPSENKTATFTADEILKLQTAVEANPENIKTYQEYIKAIGLNDPQKLIKQYEAWMKQFPKSVTVPFAIAEGFYKSERAEATPYLLKVVSMDPKRGDVYEMLAIDACRWGDYPANARYEKLAMEADPSNFQFARHYALALKGRDHGEWKTLCRDVEKRFAGTDNGAQALGLIGIFSDDPKEKEAIFLEQINKYPADKFPSTKNSMASLGMIYLTTAPDKALTIYKQVKLLDTAKSSQATYAKYTRYAETFITAQGLINKQQYKEAFSLLNSINAGRYDGMNVTAKLALMKAEALSGMGDNVSAYDSLMKRVVANPGDDILAALKTYGKKLGKNEQQIETDRWNSMTEKAKPAPDFDLYAYLQKKNISLNDLRGKTVFLSFWFPGCGPCRAEMVHLEPVMKKITDKNFIYVGINGLTEQDPYVESFMKKTGFSFMPLQDLESKISKAYGVRGYPTNFIIDPTGKIIYTGFMISNPYDERMLELMIQSVLDHKSS